jgi:hypothetical protein
MPLIKCKECGSKISERAMVESAVGQDPAKELTAVRVVSCLAKIDKLPGSLALSVLGGVARNSNDPKLRREAYDAIENLTLEPKSIEKLAARTIWLL